MRSRKEGRKEGRQGRIKKLKTGRRWEIKKKRRKGWTKGSGNGTKGDNRGRRGRGKDKRRNKECRRERKGRKQ